MAVRRLSARLRHIALARAPFAEGLGLAIACGRLAPLPFARDGLWWLTLVVAAIWIAYVRERSPRIAFAWGFTYGFLSLLGTLAWIYVRAADHLGWRVVAVAVVACAVEALPVGLGTAAFSLAARRSRVAFFVGAPACYAALETLRASGPLALPYALLGLTQTTGPLAGTLATGGVPLATFVAVALAASLGTLCVALAKRERVLRRDALAAFGTFAILTAACAAALHANVARDRPRVARIAVVQAGPIGLGESFGATADRYAARTATLRDRKPDYVLWPEGVLFLTESDANRQRAAARRAARSANVPLLAGGTLREGGALRNVLLEIRPDGSFEEIYAKRELVPFGEYQPFALLSRSANRAYTAGLGPPVVRTVRGAPFGVLICYEVAFPNVARASASAGAAYLAAILNDSWFAGTDGPGQQTQLVRARALEEGLDVVRLDAVAPSGLIDPAGAWVAPPLRGDGVAVLDVRGPVATPFRTLPPFASTAVLGLGALLVFRRLRTG